MEGLMEVFGMKGGSSPRSSSPGATDVEAFEENRINEQVAGYMQSRDDGTRAPQMSELHNLPGGGLHDRLLEPGHSAEFVKKLPSIFRGDPPVNCGANAELVGLSCAFGERYSSQVFSPMAVAKVLQLARDFWNPRPSGNVQKLTIPSGSRLIVVGDVHGQLEDVLWMFFKHGAPSAQNQYLFNGDIVDRGGHSLEILLLLFCIKRDCKDAVHLQRGNHEDVQCSIHFGFKTELHSKYGSMLGGILWNLCGNIVFPLMPIVATVLGPLTGGRRFGVLHGGVPVNCPGQTKPISLDEDIGKVDRSCPTVQATKDFHSHVLFNLLWSDPADGGEGGRARGNHGRGNRFTEKDTNEFCAQNGLAFIVRSHEVPRSLRGAVATHGGKCFTVFSASNYMGSTGNRGGVFIAEVGKGLQLREHFAPPWPVLDTLLSKQLASEEEKAKLVEDWENDFHIARAESGDKESKDKDSSSKHSQVPPIARSNYEAQQNQFVMERICEHKDQLFTHFRSLDEGMTGMVHRTQWADVMLAQLGPVCPEVLSPALLEKLAGNWGLQEEVGYVRFLHRFQIRGPDGRGSAPDLMREVSKLRRQLLDAPAQSLERLLDPNGDRTVSCGEFVAFLPQFNIDVPPCQAGALYECMTHFAKQEPLTLDSTILCLSIMSRDPAPPSRWGQVAEQVGMEILNSGKTYAWAFRYWDTDRDGYLSLDELQRGLSKIPLTQKLDADTVMNFMSYIEGIGVTNNRVSMFEFLRAVAPRKLSMELHQSMLKEILKRVWICRPALQTLLAHFDPGATNKVTVEEFRMCLGEINNQLENRGRPLLSDMQVSSICEIASSGTRSVAYDRFIRGLHVVDMGATG